MTLNEESAKNLKFLIQKNKIDVTKVDSNGFSALHHLANINVTVLAKSNVQDKEEVERPRYFMRKGKKIKMKSYSNRRHQHWQDLLAMFISNPEDKKEFPVLLKKLV